MWKKLSEFLRRTGHPSQTRKFLLLILLLAAVPRIFLLMRISEDDFYHNDGREYMEISRQLAGGNGFSLSYYRWHEPVPPDHKEGALHPDLARTPLFPLLGAGLFLLPFPVFDSARAVSLLLSLLAVYSVFLLGSELAGRRCGLWSALLFAFYPYALYYTISWSTENLFLICLALAFYFLLKTLHRGFSCFPWCGFWLGLATLTRPTAVLLPAIFLAFVWIRFSCIGALKWNLKKWKSFHLPSSGDLRRIWGFLLIFLLILLPWMWRNKQVAGTWNPATYYDGYIFWLSFSEIMTETYRTLDAPEYAEASTRAWKREHEKHHKLLREKGILTFRAAADQWRAWGWEWIRRHPGKAAFLLKERFLHYWRMCPNLVILASWQIWLIRIYFAGLWILASGGILCLIRRVELLATLLPIFFGMAISIPFLFVLRFRFPFFAPYICILGGTLLTILENRIKTKDNL